MKLILIEDDHQDARICQTAVEDFNDDNADSNVQLEIYNNIDDGLNALNNSYFDGAIIDMKLAADGNEGNQALDLIRGHLKRLPVAICTGTPDPISVLDDIPLIGVFKKGEVKYIDIIMKFWDIYITGLTKIMGGVGQIEKSLSQIFIKHLLPEIFTNTTPPEKSNWVHYAKENSCSTEKALLRHTLNHLIHELYKSNDNCYPEEMYIHLPEQERPRVSVDTGCILKNKIKNKFYIVMSPACDLAEREGGGCNTDRALLVEIQMLEDVLESAYFITDVNDIKKLKKQRPNEKSMSDEEYLSSSQYKELIKYKRNTKNSYYFWLPKTRFFNNGAVINFRRVSTYDQAELDNSFNNPVIQVSSPFLKDIISRFSSYYARQGQPDINTAL